MVLVFLAALVGAPAIFTFDAHVHVINRQFYHGGDIGDRVKDGQFDLPRAKEGGVNALFFSLFVTEECYPQHYETKQALRLVDLALRQIHKNNRTIGLALNGSDIDRIVKSGKIATVLDMKAASIATETSACFASSIVWGFVLISCLLITLRMATPIPAVLLRAGTA